MRKVQWDFFFEGIKSSEGRESALEFSSHTVYSNWKLASPPLVGHTAVWGSSVLPKGSWAAVGWAEEYVLIDMKNKTFRINTRKAKTCGWLTAALNFTSEIFKLAAVWRSVVDSRRDLSFLKLLHKEIDSYLTLKNTKRSVFLSHTWIF